MKKPIAALAASMILLTGCGGGGGGGGGGSSTLINIGDLATAKKVMEYVLDVTSIETLTYSLGKTWILNAPPAVSLTPLSLGCTSGSGTATRSDPDNDPSNLTVGERVSLVFNDCVLSSGTLKGALVMTVTAVSGAPKTTFRNWSTTMTVDYQSLQIDNQTSSGILNLVITAPASGVDFTGSIASSGSFTVSVPGQTSRTLSNFNYNYIEGELDPTTLLPKDNEPYSLGGSGSVRAADQLASSINGSVNFSTTTDFAGINPKPPTEGVITVVGAAGTKVKATVRPVDSKVDLDVGDNGTIEGTFLFKDFFPQDPP